MLNAKEKHLNGKKGKWEDIGAVLNDLKEFSDNYSDVYRKNSGITQDVLNFSNNYYGFSTTNETMFVQDTYENLNSFVSQRDDLLNLIKWPGISTALAIAFSITLLSLSEGYNGFRLLFSVVLFALFALCSVLRAAWKILDAIQRLE